MGILPEILIVLLLISINGLFALSEMAVVSARKTRLQQRAEDGDKGAEAALALSQDPSRFLSTIQVGITLIGILSGAFGGATIAQSLASLLEPIPWLAEYANALAVGIVVIVITFLSLIIGELVPKRVALNNAESISSRIAAPMNTLSRLASPIVSFLSGSTEVVLRILGIKPSSDPEVTEEEIKMMIVQGAQLGVFEETEQEIVERVFRLGDRRASSLMVYRTDIVLLDIQNSPEVNLQKIVDSGYSRFPVCNGSPDEVLGIIQVKDLFAQQQACEPLDLESIIQPALFIPEAMPALRLLEYLREKKSHLALVIDEFGGLIGLVTINDILEAIVGDIPTMDDKVYDSEIVEREDGSYLLSGTLSTEELRDLLDLDNLPEEEEVGYETLGGMLMSEIGHIPSTGDVIHWQNWRFEVVDMDGYRVDKVLVTQEQN